jgi:putative peptide zinc metalloprotease protein
MKVLQSVWLKVGTGVAVLALGAGAFVLTDTESAPADGGNNVAVAINTKDGSSVFKIRVSIRRENGEVVDTANAAVAYASCTNCQTVAVAFQVILITNDADVITPENLAIAINEGCSDCETLASAYQWAYSTDGQVRFTPEGEQRIAEIRAELRRLRRTDRSIVEIQAELDRLADELATVLTNELVVAGKPIEGTEQPPETGGDGDTGDDQGDGARDDEGNDSTPTTTSTTAESTPTTTESTTTTTGAPPETTTTTVTTTTP